MVRGKTATCLPFIPDFSGQGSAAFVRNKPYYLGPRFFFFEGKQIAGIKVLTDPSTVTWEGVTYTNIDTPQAFGLTLINKNGDILLDNLSLQSIAAENAALGRPAYDLTNIDWEASYIQMNEQTYSGNGTLVFFQFEFN